MYLVFLKFVEVFTRAGLVVGTSYSLPLDQVGQFGIVATLIGLFAFAFNWERQVDIQRRFAGQEQALFDRAISDAVPFWAFNQLVLLPVFALVAGTMAHLTLWQLMLAVAIVSGEHVANQTYQTALISPRYFRFVTLVTLKNVVVLLAVLPWMLFAPSQLSLDYVLLVWAVGQVLCAATVLVMWRRMRQPAPHDDGLSRWQRLFAQHRASFTHFQIGAVSISMLQLDRLTVGALLPLAEAGYFFRHVLIVSMIYQFFNVASFNRIMPSIFAAARNESDAQLIGRIRPEVTRMFIAVSAGFVIGVAIDAALGRAISDRYQLSIGLALLLVTGALIRVLADYAGMIANVRHREQLILKSQSIAMLMGAVLFPVLTWRFGVFGTAVASVVVPTVLLAMIARAIRGLRQEAAV